MQRRLGSPGGRLLRGSTLPAVGGLPPASRSRLAVGSGVPPAPGAWRRHLWFLPWLLIGLAALILVLSANEPGAPRLRTPQAPRIHAPPVHIHIPHLQVHLSPEFPAAPGAPTLTAPGLPGVDTPSPDLSGGGAAESPDVPSTPAQ